ncbi:tetratricopeptide repeat protein [Microbaculum marinum]|uniref:Tetratricopeptide repeat protein n=1 Tax=Microbaculum marinum TaxID=1764581 RepID=A0AAW9RMR6_9HYPH
MNDRPSDRAARSAAVREDLAANRIETAVEQARSLLADYRDDLRCHLLWSEILAVQGRHAEAVTYCEALLDQWPDNPWLLARLVSAHMANGDPGAAIALYRTRVEDSSLPNEDKNRIARNLAAANRRSPEARDILERRLSAAPDDPALLRDIASARLALGHVEEALEAFSRSATLSPLPGWAAMLHLNALIQHRRFSNLVPVADPEVLAILKDALTRFPGDAVFVRVFSQLPMARTEWAELYRLIRANFDSPDPNAMLRFEVAKACLQASDFADARRILEALDPESHWGKVSRPLLTVLTTIPDATWKRTRLSDDPAAEVQVVRTPGASMTVLVFATLTGNFMMLPIACIDALLADLPVHVIYLRDTVFGSALTGLRSLGPDITATLTGLRRIIADLDGGELVTVGASVSGLAAIRYGARLGAGRVVTFGALTTVDPEFQGTPARLQRTLRWMQQQPGAREAERFGDVVTELAQAPAMRVDLHVGGACELDLQQAHRLAGNPQIRVHREAGVDHHYVALSTIARGSFSAAVAGGVA